MLEIIAVKPSLSYYHQETQFSWKMKRCIIKWKMTEMYVTVIFTKKMDDINWLYQKHQLSQNIDIEVTALWTFAQGRNQSLITCAKTVCFENVSFKISSTTSFHICQMGEYFWVTLIFIPYFMVWMVIPGARFRIWHHEWLIKFKKKATMK